MSDNCDEFKEWCEDYIADLYGKAPRREAAIASMQLLDAGGTFTRRTAGHIAVKALERAAGTSCAQCPVLKAIVHDCHDLIGQTQENGDLPN